MELSLFQIDAFTDTVFGGNPACVMPLSYWLPDESLLKIAAENAVAETAFFVQNGDEIALRWFTPEIEMDLCGHATLAAAHALKTLLGYSRIPIIFQTKSGALTVTEKNGTYILDFPTRRPVPSALPIEIERALSKLPQIVLRSRDFVLVYEREQDIRELRIERGEFDRINLDPGGVAVTAPGESSDFVSRFFTPQSSILEDPVTGSAHCSLIPYWSERLKKKELSALQLSARGGTLSCVDQGERVLVGGRARTYSVGKCWIE